MTEIVPGLWIGSVSDAFDTHLLRRAGVTTLLNVAEELEFAGRIGVEYAKIGISDDSDDEDMRTILPDAVAFLERVVLRKGGAVMVHCLEGRSRSVCIALAFAVTCLGCHFDECLASIRARRPDADPWLPYLSQTKSFCSR